METKIQIFNNPSFGEVRVAEVNGEPMFCLADVCKILDIKNTSQCKTRLNEKGMEIIDLNIMNNNGVCNNEGVSINELGNRSATFVNESNLYKCIFQSRRPDAEKFQDWVFEDVLPSIRKHGAYMTDEAIEKTLTDPDYLIKLATTLKEEKQRRIEAENKLIEQKPSVVFAEAVETSRTSILIGELATILKQNGINIGQNRLYDWLRSNGYLIQSGDRKNRPTQMAMEMDLFEVLERTVQRGSEQPKIARTTKVTGKGQIYFINKFLGKIA